jgi:hypothetical protein
MDYGVYYEPKNYSESKKVSDKISIGLSLFFPYCGISGGLLESISLERYLARYYTVFA